MSLAPREVCDYTNCPRTSALCCRGTDGKGGFAGIGAAIATNLAEKGANVLIGYLTEASDKPAAELAQELASKHNVTAVPCRADISTPEGAKAVIDACRDKFPANPKTGKLQVDIIINSAAVMPTGPVEGVTPEEFHQTYATNVLGPILLVGQAKPYLPTDRSGTYTTEKHPTIRQSCRLLHPYQKIL